MKSSRQKYVDLIKSELAHSNYLNGWLINWYQEKLKELTQDENNFN